MGEAEVGEVVEAVVEKGRISMVVGLALRTGNSTLTQGKEASQAVEVASLEVVKQVTYSVMSAATTCMNMPWRFLYSDCRRLQEG